MLHDVNAQLLEHINLYFPINVALLESSESLDLFVDSMFEQANALGFQSYAVSQSFADHSLLLGYDFYKNPLYSDFVTPLFSEQLDDEISRFDLLYDKAWPYIEKVRGLDGSCAFIATAMLKNSLKSSAFNHFKAFDSSSILSLLINLYPEKYACHSQDELSLFLAESQQRALSDGFSQAPAQVLYSVLAFFAGLGFYHDPLIIGALPSFWPQLSAQEQQNNKFNLLSEAALNYCDAILVQAKKINIESNYNKD